MSRNILTIVVLTLIQSSLFAQNGLEIPNIESAQRALQERYMRFYEIADGLGYDLGGAPSSLTFPNREYDGRNPGLYPEDCFYEPDIINPETGRVNTEAIYYLIGDLVNQPLPDWEVWLHPSWHNRMEGKEATSFKPRTLEAPVYPGEFNSSTYLQFFKVFTERLDEMVALNFQVETTNTEGDPSGSPMYRGGYTVSDLLCSEAMAESFSLFESDTPEPIDEPGVITNMEQMQYNYYDADDELYRALIYATEGTFIIEHAASPASARVYATLYDTAVVTHGQNSTHSLPSGAPHDKYQEWFLVDAFSMSGASTYISDPPYAYTETAFQIPCASEAEPGFANGEFFGWGIVGRLIVTPDFQHHPSSALIACSDGCGECLGVAGTCSELKFGSIDYRIGLGKSAEGEVGSLQLYAQSIQSISASPLGLNLDLNNKDANILRDAEYDNVVKQVISDQVLIDVEIVDPYRKYAVRHYAIDDAGTVQDGFYQPDSENAFKTVTVENPDPPQYQATANTDLNESLYFMSAPNHGITTGILFHAFIDSTGPILPEFSVNGQLKRSDFYVLYAYDANNLTMMWWDSENEVWNYDAIVEADDTHTLSIQSPQPFGTLNITESTGTRTRTIGYSSLAGSAAVDNTITMSDVMDNKQRNHTTTRVFDPGDSTLFTDTIIETDGNGGIIGKTEMYYKVFPWNNLAFPAKRDHAEVVKEIRDPDGDPRITIYEYYDDFSTDGDNYERLKSVEYSDGSWIAYEYDANGRTRKIYSPYKDSSLSLGPSGNRMEDITRQVVTNLDGSGVDGMVITRIESIDGDEVSRRYELHWSEPVDGLVREATVEAVSEGAPWNAAANRRTDRWTIADGPFSGKVAKLKRADGTMSFYAYSVDPVSGEKTTTVRRGVPNAAGDDVVDGTEAVTVVNAKGGRVSRVVSDIESAIVLESAFTESADFDELGRPLVTLFHDGTFETREYEDCCGIVTITDRTGLTRVEYTEMDGTLTAVQRNGITTNYEEGYQSNGVIGFTRSTVVEGRGSAESVTNQIETYDPARRLIASLDPRDGVNRLTRFDDSINGVGQLVSTTTLPDEVDIVDIFHRDGFQRLHRMNGLDVTRFEYGVESDTHEIFDGSSFVSQSFKARTIKEIRLGMSGEETEWEKRYLDMLGRVYKVETPDADGNAVGNYSLTFYDTRGFPKKTVDPDGVATLFVYNERGEREFTALDIDDEGEINKAGTQRITRVTRQVLEDLERGDIVRRTTSVWETDNQDVETEVSVRDASTDGLHVWESAYNEPPAHTETIYQGNGTVVQKSTLPDGTVRTLTEVNGFLESETVTHPAEGTLSSLTHVPDDFDRRFTSTDNLLGVTTTFECYDNNQLRKIITPDSELGAGDSQTTEFFYDVMDRLLTTKLPNQATAERRYHDEGTLKQVFGHGTNPVEWVYDRQGRVRSMTTWQEFNTSTEEGVQGKDATTTWTYNAQGLLRSKQDHAAEEVTYTYTAGGRLRTRDWARLGADEINPVKTVYSYGPGGAGDTSIVSGDLRGIFYQNDPEDTPEVGYAYHRSGRVATIEDASGKRELGYDEGLLDLETYVSGGADLFTGISINRGYDLRRLDEIVVGSQAGPLYSVDYAYNNSPYLKTAEFGGHQVTYAHNPGAAVRQTLTYHNGESDLLTVSRHFDDLDRLTKRETSVAAGATYSYGYQYTNLNQRERMTLEDGKYWSYGHDDLGQVESGVKKRSDDTDLSGYAYGYTFDHIGNRTEASVNGRSAPYSPNLLNQYEDRAVPRQIDVLGSANPDAALTLDGDPIPLDGGFFYEVLDLSALPNADDPQWEEFTVTGTLTGGGANDSDRVAEEKRTAYLPSNPETFDHDADGNLLQDGRWNYTWNGENRLIRMESFPAAVAAGARNLKLEFVYDSQGRRVRKTLEEYDGGWAVVEDHLFVYEGWNLLAKLEAATLTVQQSYLWGLDLSGIFQGAGGVGGLLMIATGDQIHYPVYDGNGNIMRLLNAETGTESAQYEYGPFGEPIRTTGPMAEANPFRFSTKYEDAETGSLYYGYRYYDSSTGRWLNRDPIEERGGVNLYGFVGNCPVCATDFLGLKMCPDKCAQLESLLAGDPTDLHDAIRSNLIGEGITEQQLEQVVQDLAVIGQMGGDLGNAFLARTLFGENLTIYNQPDGPEAIRNSLRLGLDFSSPLYLEGLQDFSDVLPGGPNEGIFSYDEIRLANSVVWRRETVVAHELGHAYIGVSDPYNVAYVQNRIALAFNESGYTELVVDRYGGQRIWPRYVNSNWSIPMHQEGRRPGMPPTVRRQTYDEYWENMRKSKRLLEDFFELWGCE